MHKVLSKSSLVAQRFKRLPGMWETQVRSLGWEDPLAKEMATHSSNPLQNPMEGGGWWATVHGVAKSWTRLSNFTFTFSFTFIPHNMGFPGGVSVGDAGAGDLRDVGLIPG